MSPDIVVVGSVDSDSIAVAAAFAAVEVAVKMSSMSELEAVVVVHNTQHSVVYHKSAVDRVVQRRR